MDKRIRLWIVEVLKQHQPLLAIAMRQRAKFEGWLKFELALYAEHHGATSVEVEKTADPGSRCDLSFIYEGKQCDIELKTCNTNWRMNGVLNLTKPITMNIDEVIVDGGKLRLCHPQTEGVVAFCLFPVACGDGDKWLPYLDRIGSKFGVTLSDGQHTSRVTIPIGDGYHADILIVTFVVPKIAVEPVAAETSLVGS
jgi:hypothetical protein